MTETAGDVVSNVSEESPHLLSSLLKGFKKKFLRTKALRVMIKDKKILN